MQDKRKYEGRDTGTGSNPKSLTGAHKAIYLAGRGTVGTVLTQKVREIWGSHRPRGPQVRGGGVNVIPKLCWEHPLCVSQIRGYGRSMGSSVAGSSLGILQSLQNCQTLEF